MSAFSAAEERQYFNDTAEFSLFLNTEAVVLVIPANLIKLNITNYPLSCCFICSSTFSTRKL